MTNEPKLVVRFFRTSTGREPVRDWLSDPKQISIEDRKTIGEAIKTIQFGWPIGMPMVRKLEPDLWEVRSTISVGIARVIFTIHNNLMSSVAWFCKEKPKDSTGRNGVGEKKVDTG